MRNRPQTALLLTSSDNECWRMPANDVTDAEAKTLAVWVLSLK